MSGAEKKYFEKWLEEKFDNIESKIDANTKLTEANTNLTRETVERVRVLEHVVKGEPSKKDLPPFYRDPKVIQTILYLSITLMLLVAAAVKFDVGKLL